MPNTTAPALENQLVSHAMRDRERPQTETAAIDPLTADAFSGFLPTISIIAVAGALLFGVMAQSSGEPLVLTVIALLAMLGVFLLFAFAAGHIRLGAARATGELLQHAFDASDEPQVIVAADGTVAFANAAYQALMGSQDAGAPAVLETHFSGDAAASQALFRLMRAAERGESRFEEIAVRPGSFMPGASCIRVSVRPFAPRNATNANERLAFWRISDVSAERTREAERVGHLESSLATFDAMPAGFMAVADDGAILHINATFERWLGYAAGTLRSRRLTLPELAGVEGAHHLRMIATLADADQRVVDLDLNRQDGRMLALSLLVEPRAGDKQGFSVTAFNRVTLGFSDRGNQDVRASQFFQSAPFGIAVLDAEGHISNFNAAFMRLVFDGVPVQDVLAKDALGRTAEPTERERIEAALREALAGRGNIDPVEITAGDQKQFAQRVYMQPLAAVAGGATAAVYVVDTTEQKALEGRVAQAQKMEAVGKLAGGIAHDFNNVLTAIIGFSDLLLQTHRPSDPAYRDIKNIQSAANRAAGLVANLLGFSRKQTQQVTTVDLAEFTAEMAPILKTSVGEKIDLKIQSERDLWYVKADGTQLFNVILNLARNARDAMPSGGKLTIRTRNVSERDSQKLTSAVQLPPAEYVQIEVSDTGTGMSPEVMTKIFEPFFTTKGVGKGTGLGLASVYGIIKQSGGFIVPESELGKGTTFRVLLPRYVAEESEDVETALPKAVEAAARNLKAADLTGTGRVLLVEDELEVRQFAVRALKRQGYQVLEAADGVEALELMAANEGEIDIVVSDVVMPEMDGPALFKELRKRNPSIKVIFVSGYPNEAFRESMGSDDFAFLPKPFSLPQLAAKVKEELAKTG